MDNCFTPASEQLQLPLTSSDLTLGTEIETACGVVTRVRALVARGYTGTLRCQTPFRTSTSYAAFYSTNPNWPVSGTNEIVVLDRSLAVALAAKTMTVPCGGEVRVVHTPTGEVIFRKDCGHG